MKKIKYMVTFLLLLLVFSFIGESFMMYLDTFEEYFYNTTMYKPAYISDKTMKEDIQFVAENNKVKVFFIEENISSAVQTDITIYTTPNTVEVLKNKYSLSEKKYNSLLLGTATVHVENFESISNMNQVTNLYLMGDKKDVEEFKSQLVDKYSGNFPREGMSQSESKKNIIFVWAIILIVLILFTYYDILFTRKEVLIRLVFGESLHRLVLKQILTDLVFFTGIFITTILITSSVTYAQFHISLSIILFSLFLLINSSLYITLYFANIKEAFSNIKNEKKLLYLNYGLKVISVLLTIIIVSSCIGIIAEGFTYYKQKNFFEEYKDYSYIKLHYPPEEDSQLNEELNINTANIREKFYAEYFDKSFQLVNMSMADYRVEEPMIMANRQSIPYLIESIPELKSIDFKEQVYYIAPKKYESREKLQSDIEEINNDYFLIEGTNETWVTYESDSEILSVDGVNYLNRSKHLRNPIIILNNMDPDSSDIIRNERRGYYAYDIMYDISKKEFQQFIQKNELENQIVEMTNVHELYEYNWGFFKRGIVLASVLLVLMLLLESFVIGLILRLEYTVNAMELSLKKIMGYSIWERNKMLLVITLSATFTSILGATAVNYIFQISEAGYFLYGGTIILFIECIFILINIRKIDRADVPKILKGGVL